METLPEKLPVLVFFSVQNQNSGIFIMFIGKKGFFLFEKCKKLQLHAYSSSRSSPKTVNLKKNKNGNVQMRFLLKMAKLSVLVQLMLFSTKMSFKVGGHFESQTLYFPYLNESTICQDYKNQIHLKFEGAYTVCHRGQRSHDFALNPIK